jgi:DNA topoisomerase I
MITAQVHASQVSALQDAEFTVVDKHEQVIEEAAPPPYTTASLMQDAINLYGWSSSKVMEVAQLLFENGLITYPRTDSTSIAPEAAAEARTVASRLFDQDLLDPQKSWRFTESSEGAHEAIRPTYAARLPDQLPEEVNDDMKKLYSLIWRRYLAWFMRPATYKMITVELEFDEDKGL